MSKTEETGVDESFSKPFEGAVSLPTVKVVTGEESEEVLFKRFE